MNTMPTVTFLARARQRCAVGTMLAIAGVAALLAFAVLAMFDVLVPLPAGLRAVLSLGVAVVVLAWIAVRGRAEWGRHTPNSTASVMEAAHPELGQQIRTALEVRERGVPEDAAPEVKLFTGRLMAQSEAALERFSWAALVPRGRWALWILAATGLAMVLGVTATRWPDFRLALARFVNPAGAGTYTQLSWSIAPNQYDDRHPPRLELRVDRRLVEPVLFVRERGGEWVKTPLTALPDGRSWDIVLSGHATDLEIYAAAGDARTPVHTLVFKPIPRLIGTHVHLTYPEYTGLKPDDRNQGDVKVVEETKVRWDFEFNVPPDAVEFRMGSDPAQRLKVNPGTATVSAEWTAGTMRQNAIIAVLDGSGEATDSWRYIAEGFADALPTVELLEPAKDIEATNITELPVRIRAKDDFGVAEVGLIVEAAGHREWALEKVIPQRDQRNVTEIATAMLEKVPLTFRDNVRLYAYALDHKPRGGPRAVSPLRAIDIREFKKRWRFQESNGGGGASQQQLSDAIMKLGKLITTQRTIVSDTFLLRESTRSAGAAATTSARPIGQRELDLSDQAGQLQEQWENEGGISRDDVAMLETAIAQMQEAAASLGFAGPANVDKGFASTDRALGSLLQLRKRLLTILMRASGGGQDPPEEMKPLADLAREAERLAREENDVRLQLMPEVAAGTNLEATKRQHEVAVSDAGELYAQIVDHAQKNETAIRLMGDAEKAMRDADATLHGPKPRDARPQLNLSERRLRDVADFLRAMELTQAAETLKKMAGKAEQNAKETRGAATGPGQQGQQAQNGQQQQPPQSLRPQQRVSGTQQASRNAMLADKILEGLAEKAGGKQGAADNEAETRDEALGNALSQLRDQTAPGKVAEQLDKLAQAQQAGGDGSDVQQQAKGAADKLDAMAREFREAARRIEASRAARLAAAQAQAEALKKELAGNEPGNKPGEKPGNKPGDKPGQQGGDGKKPGDGQKPGDGAGGLAQNKPGDKPGENGAGNKPGDQPGNKPGNQPGEKPGLAQGKQPGDQPGQGGGNKPEDNKEGGRGGIAGDQDVAKLGPGGQAMGRFGKALDSIGDDQLHRFAIQLFNAPFSRDSLPLVEQAARRIEELLAKLPEGSAPVAATGRVPDARRREVEDYFRSLSDDFGSEQWGANTAPGPKTP